MKESITPPNPESFCLILDNNYFSINFPQKYISCLIFYENVSQYRKLYDKYKSYEDEENIIRNSVTRYNDGEINLHNYETNLDYNLSEAQIKTVTNSPILNLSQMRIDTDHSSESNFSQNYNTEIKSISSIKSSRLGGDSLRMSKNVFSSLTFNQSNKYKNYYVPKCICLVSVYPFFIEFSKILKTIYKFTKSPKLKKPLEKIIENLVIEVPVPPRGFYSVEYQLFNEKYILSQTPMNQLPFLSIEFEKIFVNFKIEQILEIYKHVLLETRIIFFSQDISNLTPIIQGFLSLIYPFKFPFQYVTILPNENFNFLESVSPYIIGINQRYTFNFFQVNELDMDDMTVLVIDIDNRRLELSSPNLNKVSLLSERKILMANEFPDLPKHYKNKLMNRINEYINKIKTNSDTKEDRDNFSLTIRNLFFQFVVNILQNYNKYLNIDYYTNNEISSPSIQTLFKVEDFINSCDYSDRPFYRKLVNETQIFVEFILKRMIPKDSKEKLEILLFDENLIEKNSRRLFSKKVFTPFIHSNLYDIKHTYSVQKSRGFNEEEINYFENSLNRKMALKYGQEIFFEKGEIFIHYPVFPILLNNLYFKNSMKLYYIPPNLSEELEPINVDIVSKSHLGSVSIHHSEMENYIYLCWIQLWASTFWYHDEEEKRYRFQQLLKVLDSVINHEMEIFNLLFEALSKYGEDYMTLKLYERLVFYKLNPSYSICTTVMKLIDKKQILNKLGVGSIIKYVERYDFNKIYDTNKFRKRIIKNKFDLNILTNDAKFYTWDTCIDCQTNINLEKLSRDFHNMRRDILWVSCPNCGTGLLPKIAVRFGNELNHYDKLKFNTSSYEGFVLYSPFYLKYNYNNGLLKEFGIRLDVESFKLRFNAIFWDSIWYFKIKNLVFDFMLPYENEVTLEKLNLHVKSTLKIKTVSKIEIKIKNDENLNTCDNLIDNLKDNETGKENVKENITEDMKLQLEGRISDNTNENPINNYINTADTFSHVSPIKLLTKYSSDNKIINHFNYIRQSTANLSIFSSSDKINNFNRSHSSFKLEKTCEVNFSAEKHYKESILTKSNLNSNKDLPFLMTPNNEINLNMTSDFTNTILVTEQSFINPNYLIDNSVLHDMSRVLDTDQSILSDLDSTMVKKNFFNIQLKTINEDIEENINLDIRENSSDFNKIVYDSPYKLSENNSRNFNSHYNSHETEKIIDIEKERYSSNQSSCSEVILATKKTSLSENNAKIKTDRDKTPKKNYFSSDSNIIEILQSKLVRKASLDLQKLDKKYFIRKISLKQIIDDIDIEDKEINETKTS